jgi:hypothetical protein
VLVSKQVASMDPDVMITAAFCLEVFLLALAAAVAVAREARKGRAEAGPASANVGGGEAGPRVTAGRRRTFLGMH